MQKTIYPGPVCGELTAPASKSYAQRAIAAVLLAGGRSELLHMGLCDDTRAAIGVARALGAEIAVVGTACTVSGGLEPRASTLHIGESGLATRLFTPIAALCSQPVTITGEGSILRRPVGMMTAPLEALGARVVTSDGYLPLTVTGPLRGGVAEVDGSLSSQFITGLLMALPLAAGDTTLHVDRLNSIPYIDMTLGVLAAFGIEVSHEEYRRFFIPGGQSYVPASYNIEGDWSGASCLLVAGAVAGEVTVTNLDTLSLQADRAILDALSAAGAEVVTERDRATVRRRGLRAFRFDATHCPDLFPALVALAAYCEGETVLTGTTRLTHKESDRAQTLAGEFGKLGVRVDISEPDTMRVTGGPVHGATAESHGDHRIAMALATAALGAGGPVTIGRAEVVNKSYDRFWDDLSRITDAKD
ncbi:MAG: 3-phosphoshikimate 1-carboxyvinyltransferase [Rikenellaceae bacterium]|nr:3-phosphoshikimate 1-carboxyvinyltransferase [Rikenellaceae bacterium]